MTPDLLPCPWCKEVPKCYPSHRKFDDHGSFEAIECANEKCPVGPGIDYLSWPEAVETWNTRADITPHHAAQLLLSYLENDNDKRQSIDPSGHCVKLIHGLRAIAEENK